MILIVNLRKRAHIVSYYFRNFAEEIETQTVVLDKAQWSSNLSSYRRKIFKIWKNSALKNKNVSFYTLIKTTPEVF